MLSTIVIAIIIAATSSADAARTFTSKKLLESSSTDVGARGFFLRSHTENLTELAKYTSEGNFITCSIFNRGYREMAANWYFALNRFGKVNEVLLATFDDVSLIECLHLGFACFDGTSILGPAPGQGGTTPPTSQRRIQLASEDVTHGNPEYHKLMWAKPLFIDAVLRLGYTVIYTDLDTVWVKSVVKSLDRALSDNDADVVGMNDMNSGNPNAGNLIFRYNDRTLRLMANWLAFGMVDNVTRAFRADIHDQAGLHSLRDTWLACADKAQCQAVKDKGMAAVWLNPWHGCPWENKQSDLCDPKYAYLHIFCTAGGTVHKKAMATELGLWFVHPHASTPTFRGAHWNEMVQPQQERYKGESYTLPCSDTALAWVN